MLWQLDPKLAQDTTENYSLASNVFSKEECEKIIELGTSIKTQQARVDSGDDDEGILDLTDRKSDISWVLPSEESEWIYRRLTDFVQDANSKFFNFDLYGFTEGLQFTKYVAPDGNYNAHVDKLIYKTIRKLSLVVQLSDPTEYEGGELNLIIGRNPTVVNKEQGLVTCFPSYTLHKVVPVTKGTRYSLVAWISGPRFR